MRWLMQHNAKLAVEVLHWFGVAGYAKGNLITVPAGTLGVDEACSGIRSLQGTLMLTLFLGEILALSWPRRFALLGSGVFWALITNVGRTVTLGLIANHGGLQTMEHWHDSAGYTVLAMCSARCRAGRRCSTMMYRIGRDFPVCLCCTSRAFPAASSPRLASPRHVDFRNCLRHPRDCRTAPAPAP